MRNPFPKFFKRSGLVLLLYLVMQNTVAFAQNPEAPATGKHKLNGGFGFFGLSATQLNLEPLNTFLAANNYHRLNNTTGSFGGGGLYCSGNFLFGGGGAWLFDQSANNSSNTVKLGGGYGQFDFGYIIYSGRRSFLYPSLGIGGGTYNIDVRKKDLSGDFAQQLITPSGAITTKAGGWLINAQMSYHLFIGSADKNGGWMLGFKAGYRYWPSAWQTTLNSAALNNSPAINMNGIYFTVTFGGGSLNNH